jgi:stress response protein YsnF
LSLRNRKPVGQQITLHEEHYEISRREVNDPQLARDIDWKDRTIEVTETSEQLFLTKTARFAEEVVIRRRGSDHVETIRDTVRRQQLEVEPVPGVERASVLKRAA